MARTMTDTLARYQARLRDLVVGAGTPYELTGPITGLGSLEPRTSDLDLAPGHGVAAGLDSLPPRSLYLPLTMHGLDPADTMRQLRTLKAAWAVTGANDVETLELRLPGLTWEPEETLTFYGRPRGIADKLDDLKANEAGALARFDALDPLGYGPERTRTDLDTSVRPPDVITPARPFGPGPGIVGLLPVWALTVWNHGDVPTTRWSLRLVTGAGDTPIVALGSSYAGTSGYLAYLKFAEDVVSEVTVDFHDRTARYVPGGLDLYSSVDPVTTWMALEPGPNTLFVAGVDSLDVTIRSAYS